MVVPGSNDGARLTRRPRAAENLLIAAITISALYAGSQLFIPLALAVLLAFVLTPALLLLRRLRVPKIPADRKSTRLNSSHLARSRMPSSA